MTVDAVSKMWSRGGGSIATDNFSAYTSEFEESYQITHSVDATDLELFNHPDVPAYGERYQGMIGVLLKRKRREVVSPIYSIVVCTYEGDPGENDDPVDMWPDVSWRAVRSSEESDTDAFGFPFTNVIGEPVEGINRDLIDFEMTVSRNFYFFGTYLQRQYLDSVNSDYFGRPGDLWPPGTVALTDFEMNEVKGKYGVPEYVRVTCKFGFRQPYNTIPARAWWARYRNEGYYCVQGTTVTFSGGGGSGAMAYAVSSSAGAITSVVVTNGGSGYTSAPTVAFTSATGTGATATATVTGDRVGSVSVSAGGSNYRASIVQAVDDNKHPVTRPVLLAADGTRQKNAGSAVWIERPKKANTLPYFALGML